jgi:hypothetical protein
MIMKRLRWFWCLRSVWAMAIAIAFFLGYLMGLYQEDYTPTTDVDMREDPLSHHRAQDEDYGFHKREEAKNGTSKKTI